MCTFRSSTYEIAELNGDKLEGKFLGEELQQFLKDAEVYKVEKALKTRKRGGKTEYFVTWKGYDKNSNSWTSDIFDVLQQTSSVIQSM